MEWESVIGLEVHVQLQTKSKIFSGASTTFGAKPNSQACAVDLGLPGVLPVLNKEAVTMAIKLGLAIDAQINKRCVFARKNYFYPDLPKGYQISQYELPIVEHGKLTIVINDHEKIIGITRAHLEEDAGKSLHTNFNNRSGIDLNRAGTPLLEVVSEPDLRSADEAVSYLKNLHSLVMALGICDGNMQEGSFRCDANVSVRPKGSEKLGTRAEIKNVNSFKFVEKAINYEIQRQIACVESGQEIIQETRLFDEQKQQTRSMRGKENANDYRYFPDPDLLPIIISEDQISKIRMELPELPSAKKQRFLTEYQLAEDIAEQLVAESDYANYFEALLKISNAKPKLIANWLISELTAILNKASVSINSMPINTEQFACLLSRLDEGIISAKIAKKLFSRIWEKPDLQIDKIIESEGLKQVNDTAAIEKTVEDIMNQFPDQVEQLRSGKTKVMGFFVGKIMKAMQGKANPAMINQILQKKLKP